MTVLAAAVGIVAGALFVGLPPGLNWFLVALAVSAPVALSMRRDLSPHTVVFAALSVALVGTAIHTSAEWLLVTNLLGAIGLASLAVAPGITWFEVILGLSATGWRTPVALQWLARSRPEGISEGRRVGAPLARGLVLGGFLLVVFGALFASADQAFAQLADRVLLVPDLDLSLVPARVVVAGAAAVFAGTLASFAPALGVGNGGPVHWAERVRAEMGGRRRRRLGRTEWMTALVMVDLLFAVFVVIQIAVLFGGRAHVLTTSTLTYAEYARSGFWQLLAVAALTLSVLAALARYAQRDTSREAMAFKILGGILIALTLVVLASALRRLSLYEEVYGFTRLRLVVHATILWLAGLFVLVACAGVFMRGRWMPRAVVAFSALTLVCFTLMRPDAFIAERNVARFEKTGEIDAFYLRGLSSDAVPALSSLPEPMRSCSLVELRSELQERETLWSFNASRDTARETLAATPESASALDTCSY